MQNIQIVLCQVRFTQLKFCQNWLGYLSLGYFVLNDIKLLHSFEAVQPTSVVPLICNTFPVLRPALYRTKIQNAQVVYDTANIGHYLKSWGILYSAQYLHTVTNILICLYHAQFKLKHMLVVHKLSFPALGYQFLQEVYTKYIQRTLSELCQMSSIS